MGRWCRSLAVPDWEQTLGSALTAAPGRRRMRLLPPAIPAPAVTSAPAALGASGRDWASLGRIAADRNGAGTRQHGRSLRRPRGTRGSEDSSRASLGSRCGLSNHPRQLMRSRLRCGCGCGNPASRGWRPACGLHGSNPPPVVGRAIRPHRIVVPAPGQQRGRSELHLGGGPKARAPSRTSITRRLGARTETAGQWPGQADGLRTPIISNPLRTRPSPVFRVALVDAATHRGEGGAPSAHATSSPSRASR